MFERGPTVVSFARAAVALALHMVGAVPPDLLGLTHIV